MNFIIRPAGPVENSRSFLSTLDGRNQHELVAVVRTAEGAKLVAGAVADTRCLSQPGTAEDLPCQ